MTVIGVIGGGQLARMMIPAAINLGIDVRVFAESEGSSAHLATSWVGDFRDFSQLERFASSVDVLTFDHEHVPLEHLETLQEAGVKVFPPPGALRLTHNKIVMREELEHLGVPQPRFRVISAGDDSALEDVGGFPAIAKLPVGGYDGKGVRVMSQWGDIEDWLVEGPVLLEEKVPFSRELAQLSARSTRGEWVAWPAVETLQVGGVCAEVISPAPGLSSRHTALAQEIARKIADAFQVVGVLAVEMFDVGDEGILVNELAMRPHNSGHVFTEQSVTSQFEQHLRAVMGTSLGSTELKSPVGVMVNIFGEASPSEYAERCQDFSDVKFHSYQKAPRPGRKAGHFVATGESVGVTVERARGALRALQGGRE